MIEITVHVDIPALDRLAAALPQPAGQAHTPAASAPSGPVPTAPIAAVPVSLTAAPVPPKPVPAAPAEAVPVQTAPAQAASPGSAPAADVPSVPLSAAPAYTSEQVSRAGAELIGQHPEKREAIMALLPQYGVQTISELRPELLGPFAAGLRELGANI